MLRLAFAILWIASATFSLATPKVATVRIFDIEAKLEAAETIHREITLERQAIRDDSRATALRAALMELEALREKLVAYQDTPGNARDQLQVSYGLKRQEALTIQQEFEEFHKLRTKEINAKLVDQRRLLLTIIHRAVAETAEAKGFDIALDVQGKTNTGLPFVLYSKNPSDITADVIKTLDQQGVPTKPDTSDTSN